MNVKNETRERCSADVGEAQLQVREVRELLLFGGLLVGRNLEEEEKDGDGQRRGEDVHEEDGLHGPERDHGAAQDGGHQHDARLQRGRDAVDPRALILGDELGDDGPDRRTLNRRARRREGPPREK